MESSGWLVLAGLEEIRRRPWRHVELEIEQPGGSRVAVFGAKDNGGCGVYMGLERLDRNRLNATNLLRIWLGFRSSFLRERLKTDCVTACVMGGAHLAVRERSWVGVGLCCEGGKMGFGPSGSETYFFFQNRFLFSVFNQIQITFDL